MENEFLDYTKEKKLSETECGLITMFRALTETQRKLILQTMSEVLSRKYKNDIR